MGDVVVTPGRTVTLTHDQAWIVNEALSHAMYLAGCFDDISDGDVACIQGGIDALNAAEVPEPHEPPDPGTCYSQPTAGGRACGYLRGHHGPHSWEPA